MPAGSPAKAAACPRPAAPGLQALSAANVPARSFFRRAAARVRHCVFDGSRIGVYDDVEFDGTRTAREPDGISARSAGKHVRMRDFALERAVAARIQTNHANAGNDDVDGARPD